MIFLLYHRFISQPSASCCKQDFPSPSFFSFFLPIFLPLSFCASDIQFSCSVVSYSLWPYGMLKLMSIELVMPFNRLILCHPLLLLPSVFPSQGAYYSLILSLFLGGFLPFSNNLTFLPYCYILIQSLHHPTPILPTPQRVYLPGLSHCASPHLGGSKMRHAWTLLCPSFPTFW